MTRLRNNASHFGMTFIYINDANVHFNVKKNVKINIDIQKIRSIARFFNENMTDCSFFIKLVINF